MAIYSYSMTNLTRQEYHNQGKNKSSNACSTVSYLTGQDMYCERTGETFHHPGIERVMYSHTFIPEGAPEEWDDNPERLWNDIENHEKQVNAKLGKRIVGALPNELDLETQIKIAEKEAKIITDMGYPVTVVIHHVVEEGKPANDHLQMLASARAWDAKKGTWKCKRHQEYSHDENGNRIPIWEVERDEDNVPIKDENGNKIYKLDENGQKIQKVDGRNRKQWKRDTIENNEIDLDETLLMLRRTWAEICNEYLDQDHQIDYRSYAEQGINQVPTVHEGFEARAWEAKGNISEKCQHNREVKDINQELAQMDAEIDTLTAENEQCKAEIEQLTALEKLRVMVENLGTRLEKALATIQARFTSPVTIEDCLENPEKILEFKSDNKLISKIIESHAFDMDADNLRAVTATVEFLDKHKINSLEKFKSVYEGLTQDINTTLKDYEALSKKLSVANQSLNARKTMTENKDVYEAYQEVALKNNPLDKGIAEDYYSRHQNEIDGYKRATAFLKDTYKQNIPTSKEIKSEINALKSQMEQTAQNFREMRILGFDMQEVYTGVSAVLDVPDYEWKPRRTLRYDIADAVPDELKIYHGHTNEIKPIKNTEREREKILQQQTRVVIHEPPEITH